MEDLPADVDEWHAAADFGPIDLFNNLQTRADTLLREFRSYQAHLKLHKKQHEVEVRAFKRGIESEVKTLKKLSPALSSSQPTADPDVESEEGLDEDNPRLHTLRSSNLPFYEAVWDVAKSQSHITALGKKMYFGERKCGPVRNFGDDESAPRIIDQDSHRRREVAVDIVADNGLKWIKVSTISEKRLLFDIAKQGWENYGDESDESSAGSDEGDLQKADDRSGKLELVWLAQDLRKAAAVARVQYQHPRIRFVLPKIREGVLPDVDAFLADLRTTGAIVQCGEDVTQILQAPRLDLDRLMPTAAISIPTPTINIDCTILLALISDISHLSRPELSTDPTSNSQTYQKAIMNQIEAEVAAPMLPGEIYPLLDGRDLHCTTHAAQRMRQIVEIMATPSERRRADILLGEGIFKDQSSMELRQAFAVQSHHCIPDDLRFPVQVIALDVGDLLSSISSLSKMASEFPTTVAARVMKSLNLTPINASVFFYGWAYQMTTVTSNRTVASGLSRAINDILDLDEREGGPVDERPTGTGARFVAPLIYTCETARSLVGKAKFK